MNPAYQVMRYRTCIIIVTTNSIRYLGKLCASLEANIDIAKDVIVFVDNGSSDGTLDYIKEFSKKSNALVLRNLENKGFGQANNMAMRAVEADFYLLLNPDTYLLNNILDDIFSYYPDPSDIDIVGPYLVYPDGSYQTSAYAFSSPLKWILQDLGFNRFAFWLSRGEIGRGILRMFTLLPMAKPFVTGMLGQGRRNQNRQGKEVVDFVTGACMLISRKVYEVTGGFDDHIFMYGDDEELCFRAKKMGFKVERVGAGPVVHYLGWGKNKETTTFCPHVHESLRYMIQKNYQDRILKKWLMLRMLRTRLRRLQKASNPSYEK